jgi:hypothetical protein
MNNRSSWAAVSLGGFGEFEIGLVRGLAQPMNTIKVTTALIEAFIVS